MEKTGQMGETGRMEKTGRTTQMVQITQEMQRSGRKRGFREFLQEEDGMGTVETILIVVVLVGLVVIFKKQMTSIVNTLFSKITQQTNSF